MNLFCVGLSHHTSNVETRERYAGHAQSEWILRNAGCAEALLLTTCNRVEVYGASEKRVSTDEIAQCLVREIEKDAHQYAPPFYRYEGEKCVQHLFRVASGLDSMVVGESEIFGQRKKRMSRQENLKRSVLICIVCFNGPFAWRSKSALTQKSPVVRYPSALSRLILPKEFSVSWIIAKSWSWARGKRASAPRVP
jgi:Glutamyl-tRNA reductase